MIVSAREVVPSIDDMQSYRCVLLEDIHRWISGQETKISGPELFLYHSLGYTEHDIVTEAAIILEKDSTAKLFKDVAGRATVRELSSALVGSVVHHGSLYDVGQAMTALYTWIGTNGYTSAGAYRELHLFWSEEDTSVDFNDIVVEIQLPIEKQ